MISSINPRIRIGIVLMGAFLISGILMRYTTGETEISAPSIQIQHIAGDFSQSVANSGSSLLASIQSFKLPSFTNISPQTPGENPSPQEPTPQEWINSPTSDPGLPTSTPTQQLPTASVPTRPPGYPTMRPTSPIVPTTKPNPTTVPKPTKPPKPTATPAPPPITTDVRPGTSIEEILREVSKRSCVPYALLMATRTEESGAWMNNMSASVTKYYNTYGWWTTAGKGEVCYALAYYTQSGLIPPDSTTALQEGTSCTNGVQPGAYDQKIMGLMQMSEDEQNVTRKYTQTSLPKSIDRRVLFDNALIYAIATKNRAGNSPMPSCDDWPEETVKLVAEKHYGACAYSGGNYCTEVWNLYKSFR